MALLRRGPLFPIYLMARISHFVAAFAVLTGLASPATTAKVSFSREVLPILSDNCFFCHGPSETGRKADLRLDVPEGAFRVKKGVAVIKPGKPEDSALIQRLHSADPDELMPPPDSHRQLTDPQKDILRRWVAEGAPWGKHWAFESLQEVPVPPAAESQKPGNAIDRFVRAKLSAEHLPPAQEADRMALVRRVHLDLTGLPPTPAEVDAFANDPSPDAYEALVDRVLGLPAYGERMAQEWLDLARYADTYGFQADVERDLSPWRDWVIGSFNDNLPFDQFLTWQLAGDLLPDPTREQQLATAFNRLHRQTNEGGSIEEEWRTEYVADRVHTMGTAFLGLTFECSRCHDHKYDPIGQRDYYSLFAFFNQIDESGLYSHFTAATPTPTMLLYGDGVEAKHRAAKAAVKDAEATLAETAQAARARFAEWSKAGTSPGLPRPVAAFPFEALVSNRLESAVGPAKASLSDNPELVPGKTGNALKFSGDNSATIEGVGSFKRTDPFTFDLWLKPTVKQDRAVVFHFSRAWTDSGSRGYELVLDQGRPFCGLIHFWPGNAIAVRARDALPTNEWTRLTVTYDGSSRAGGIVLYRNGHPLATEVVRDHLNKDIHHRGEWGDSDAGGIRLTLAGRFRDNGFKDGLLDEFHIYDTCLTSDEVARLADNSASSNQRPGSTVATYLARVDEPYRAALAALKQARDAENDLVAPIREIMTMRDRSERRVTHVLKRGAYDAPADTVEAGTPNRIFPFSADAPRNRLGLARWMTDPENPLTARVAVNRVWKLHFGRGLVTTVEDFGAQGRLPSHPELLDWLAGEFIRSGWDRKALHKLVLMSATYRQTSAASPELLARDPDNVLLARGPKHRLGAEVIRDQALAASGLLVRKIGGPSVKPYQPAGVWEESGTGKSYTQDRGEKLYRRSLYTFWRRTAPPPSMLTFDATSREVCTAKRESTTTPLQALVLLNDPQFLEAGRVLAEQLLRDQATDLDSRVDAACRHLLGRAPQAKERVILSQLLREQLDHFRANPGAAVKYLAIGERPRDEAFPADQVAATAVLASAVMNHDDFVMKR
jgi:hypothetical protein